jgi:hypothetical protein
MLMPVLRMVLGSPMSMMFLVPMGVVPHGYEARFIHVSLGERAEQKTSGKQE